MLTLLPIFALTLLGGKQGPPQQSLADIRRSIAQIRKDIASGETWKTATGKYVELFYVDGSITSQMTVTGCVELMDKAVESDTSLLKLDLPDQPIPVYLYPNLADLGHALGAGSDALPGLSLGDWAVIVSSPNFGYKELSVFAPHELGHAIVHKQLGQFCPPALAEGIAEFLQGSYAKQPWTTDPKPVEETPIESILARPTSSKDNDEAAAFCAFLFQKDNGDPTRLKKLFTNLNQARIDQLRSIGTGNWSQRMDNAFQDAYGKSPTELEAEWRSRTKLVDKS